MIFIYVAVNDDHGYSTGRCRRMIFEVNHDTKLMMSCEVAFKRIFYEVRIRQRRFSIRAYEAHANLMGWDRFRVNPDVAAAVANYMRQCSAHLEMGDEPLFDQWERGEIFTERNFPDE